MTGAPWPVLDREHALLEAVVRHMPAGVIVAEAPSGRVLMGNEQVDRILRRPFVPAASVEQYREYEGFHPDGRPYEPHEWPLARSAAGGEVVLDEEIAFRRGDGTPGVMCVNSTPVRDAEGRIAAAVAVLLDITARREAEERVRRLAQHDPLTGLPNRALFRDRLGQALALARRGGGAGRGAAARPGRLQGRQRHASATRPGTRCCASSPGGSAAAIRASDTLARLGGDEFAVVQLGRARGRPTRPRSPRQLLDALEAPFALDGPGGARGGERRHRAVPGGRGDPDELVRNADLALYRAKAEGRGRVRFFEPAMDEEVRARRRLEAELRRALERGSSCSHYQPRLDLATGRVTGVEALRAGRTRSAGWCRPASSCRWRRRAG